MSLQKKKNQTNHQIGQLDICRPSEKLNILFPEIWNTATHEVQRHVLFKDSGSKVGPVWGQNEFHSWISENWV